MAMSLSAEVTEDHIFLVLVFIVTLEAIGMSVQLFVFIQFGVLESFGFLPNFFGTVFENEVGILEVAVILDFHLFDGENSRFVFVDPDNIGISKLLKSDVVNVIHFSTLNHQSELISVSLINSFVFDLLQLTECELIRIIVAIQ